MRRLAPLLLLLATTAWANPKASRHPLPNREVERPVVLPKSWTELGFVQHGMRSEAQLRYGLAPRVDLSFRPRFEDGDLSWSASAGLRFVHEDAPARSAALRLHAGRLGLAFGGASLVWREQVGGLQFEAELGGMQSNRWVTWSKWRVLLQGGPLAVFVRGSGWFDDDIGGTAHLGGLINPTRGLDLELFGTLWRTDGPELLTTPAGLGGRVTGRF